MTFFLGLLACRDQAMLGNTGVCDERLFCRKTTPLLRFSVDLVIQEPLTAQVEFAKKAIRQFDTSGVDSLLETPYLKTGRGESN